jgi:hypothetical protein
MSFVIKNNIAVGKILGHVTEHSVLQSSVCRGLSEDCAELWAVTKLEMS